MKWKVSFEGIEKPILVNLPTNPRKDSWSEVKLGEKSYLAQWNEELNCLYLKDESGLEQSLRVRYMQRSQFPGEAESDVTLEFSQPGAEPIGYFTSKISTYIPGSAARGSKAGQDGALVRSPMVGKVLHVKTKPGDQVIKGQELLVIEAMKMENKILAPAAGLVKEVNTKEGDQTKIGQKLVVIASN